MALSLEPSKFTSRKGLSLWVSSRPVAVCVSRCAMQQGAGVFRAIQTPRGPAQRSACLRVVLSYVGPAYVPVDLIAT